MDTYILSSESVGAGHPDKIADYISDSIVDACLAKDPTARVACETLVKDNHVVLAGEITTCTHLDHEAIVRSSLRDLGQPIPPDLHITTHITTQSPDIAQGVDERAAEGKDGSEQGAGDQGIMFGYATNETPAYLPAPLLYAHMLTHALDTARLNGTAPEWQRPDSKSQVSVEYKNGYPVRITDVVIACQHSEDVPIETVREHCKAIARRTLPAALLRPDTAYHINPTGRFVLGGAEADCGLTGRKIICDTYGGMAHHGGGAFSGKDPSKVDRSAAYMCRWVAKHVVAAGLAASCEIQVAYAIGKAEPVSLYIKTTGPTLPEETIRERILGAFSFKPADIISALNLRQPMYRKNCNHGHFWSRTASWEQLCPSRLKKLKGE